MKNEIDSIFDEAIKLMEAAIKKYKEGDFEIADKRRKSANKLFKKAHEALDTDEGKDDVVYGESRNFGKIFKVFENNTNKLFETKEGSKAIAAIVKTIKNDKDLSTEFKIYEAIENPKGVKNVEMYTHDVISLIESFNSPSIKEKNQKLLEKIRSFGLDEAISMDSDTELLYENIDFLINNKKSLDNVGKFSEAKNIITETIKNNASSNIMNVDEVVDFMSEKIEEKYDKLLTEDEKEFINELTAPGVNLEKVFNTTKKNLQTSLMEAILNEPENSEDWKQLLEKVKSKTFSKETAIADIAEMVESQNIL